jgi:hypothetical protein
MLAVAFTALTLAIWLAQGIGLVHWLGIKGGTVVRGVLAIWLGLVLQSALVLNAYYLVPGLTIDQLAWPVTIVAMIPSLVLFLRGSRPRFEIERGGIWVVALSTVATLLVLRPLLAHDSLGFYFSNNGEFANYAAITDAVQFHDATENLGAFAAVSREAVTGTLAAMLSSLTGKSALWIIQPYAAALAALSFASLGILFRGIAVRIVPVSRFGAIALWCVYAWAIASASAQTFFTLSFVSQYIEVALFFGGIAFLFHAKDLDEKCRFAVLGLLIGVMACVYPEMIVPASGLLAVYELGATKPSRATYRKALVHLAGAFAVGMLVMNKLGATLILGRSGLGGGGWDIYGPHRPVLAFVARLTGFSNTFAIPHERAAMWPLLATILFVAGLAYTVMRVRKERDDRVRGLLAVGATFYVGVAGVFWLVVHKQMPTNYVALKYLLGFGWLAYLLVALVIADANAWRPRLGVIATTIAIVAIVGLWKPAVEFTKQLHRAEKTALFLEHDPCAEQIRGRVYVSAGWFNMAIIGRFLAYDRDLLSIEGRWPDGATQAWFPGQPIILLGQGRSLADDAQVLSPYMVRCSGRNFTVLEPRVGGVR